MRQVFLVSLLSPMGNSRVLPSDIISWIRAIPPVLSNQATFPGNHISSHATHAFLHILILANVSFLLPRSHQRMIFLDLPRASILLVVSRLPYCWPRMGRMGRDMITWECGLLTQYRGEVCISME